MGTVHPLHPGTRTQPSVGEPEGLGLVCPDGAADDVRAIWDYTVALLPAAAAADRDALLAYCEAVATHRKASALLARSPVIVPGALKNTVVQNPACRVQRDAANTMQKYAAELGLTPGARAAAAPPAALPLAIPHLREAT
jgi:P27 family predicted phage terminase small subunit